MGKYLVDRVVVGPLSTNCYFLVCEETNKGAIIDPGAYPSQVWGKVEELGFDVVAVINTHGHGDHIDENKYIVERSGAPLMIHEDDKSMLAVGITDVVDNGKNHKILHDGDIIEVGNLRLEVIHTPGHSPGGICLKCENLLFSGDTLFYLSVGRSDLPGGDYKALMKSIHEKIMPLDDNLIVLPGHGPHSELGYEKNHNPYLRR